MSTVEDEWDLRLELMLSAQSPSVFWWQWQYVSFFSHAVGMILARFAWNFPCPGSFTCVTREVKISLIAIRCWAEEGNTHEKEKECINSVAGPQLESGWCLVQYCTDRHKQMGSADIASWWGVASSSLRDLPLYCSTFSFSWAQRCRDQWQLHLPV